MANKDAVGRTGASFTMAVERGKVREFARATGSSHPRYVVDVDAPVPPTFLTSSTFWQPPEAASKWKDVDIDLRRLLHGGQQYEFFGRPPAAGAELSVQSRIEEIFEKEGKRGGTMTFVVTVTDFKDAAGNLVAQARSTAIETGRAPTEEGS